MSLRKITAGAFAVAVLAGTGTATAFAARSHAARPSISITHERQSQDRSSRADHHSTTDMSRDRSSDR